MYLGLDILIKLKLTTNFDRYAILKVVSCPNNENDVQIFFCPFLCRIQIILFFESVAAKETARFS